MATVMAMVMDDGDGDGDGASFNRFLQSTSSLNREKRVVQEGRTESGGFSVFAGVGERTREGNDLYREMMESGVTKLGDTQSESKGALVYGQMNEPPGARARVGLTGLTVVEHFRDVEGQDVLLFIDNIFRFTQANSEVSALLGHIPSAVGYQPTLATDLRGLQERITTTKKGGNVTVITTKDAWDQKLLEAKKHGKYLASPLYNLPFAPGADLPPKMPWMSIPFKDYWILCHDAVFSCNPFHKRTKC